MTAEHSSMTLASFARIAVFGGAALVLGAAVSGWLQSRQGATIPAVLKAKTTGIAAGRVCRLAEVFVKPGAAVVADQPLFRLADERLEARVAAKQREIRKLTAEVERVEAAAEVDLAWRRRELQGDIYRAQLEQARLLQERLSSQVEQIAWQEHLKGLDAWVGESTSELLVQPITLSRTRPNTARLEAVLKEDAAATAAETVDAQLTLCEERLTSLQQLAAQLEAKVRVSRESTSPVWGSNRLKRNLPRWSNNSTNSRSRAPATASSDCFTSSPVTGWSQVTCYWNSWTMPKSR